MDQFFKFNMTELTRYYNRLNIDGRIPILHTEYLKTIDYTPSIIYDIGSAVLHWYDDAQNTWPEATIYAFEALREVEEFYLSRNVNYFLEVLGDVDGRIVEYYGHPLYLGGNSYYRENKEYSPAAEKIYTEDIKQTRIISTLDTIVQKNSLPLPDLLKIDVQGAEVDVLKGATEVLKNVKHLIVELQHVQYNLGASLVTESLPFIESLGFKLVPNETLNEYFSGNGPDADYHFIKNA